MKDRNPFMAYPAHVYLPALVSVYIAFFLMRNKPAWAFVMPILFFVLEATGIVSFYAKDKNTKKAIKQFVFLLVVLSPIIFLAIYRNH